MAAPFLADYKSRTMPYVVIWDVKTVPDLKTFAEAKGLSSKSEDQDRAAMADEVSNPLYRSIVCLAVLIARLDSDRWMVDSIRSWSHADKFPERMMIKRFFDTIADLKAATVTFNGGTVLQYRAMREKLAHPRYSIELHNQYAVENLSLCDVLSPNSKRRISLREICAVLDMPFEGLDDDDVERFAEQERFMEIANYCEREVESIFQIWLRYQLYDGEVSYHSFRASDDNQRSSLSSVAF